MAELPEPGTRIEGTRSDGALAAVAAFAELVARPLPRGREPVAVDAPRVLHLVGDDAVVGAAEQRLAERPGTLVMGAVVADWPRAAAGDGVVRLRARRLGAARSGRRWVSAPSADGTRSTWCGSRHSPSPSGDGERTCGAAASRRVTHGSGCWPTPGSSARSFDAARTVAGSGLLVMRGDPGLALVLSHDRHLDLRVADLGAGDRPAVGLAASTHPRGPLARPADRGWAAHESRLLDGWAAPAAGTPIHGPDVSLRPAGD